MTCRVCRCVRPAHIFYNGRWLCKEHYDRFINLEKEIEEKKNE